MIVVIVMVMAMVIVMVVVGWYTIVRDAFGIGVRVRA